MESAFCVKMSSGDVWLQHNMKEEKKTRQQLPTQREKQDWNKI